MPFQIRSGRCNFSRLANTNASLIFLHSQTHPAVVTRRLVFHSKAMHRTAQTYSFIPLPRIAADLRAERLCSCTQPVPVRKIIRPKREGVRRYETVLKSGPSVVHFKSTLQPICRTGKYLRDREYLPSHGAGSHSSYKPSHPRLTRRWLATGGKPPGGVAESCNFLQPRDGWPGGRYTARLFSRRTPVFRRGDDESSRGTIICPGYSLCFAIRLSLRS